MDKYTIYCTEEQTKTALELGAPINLDYHKDDFENSIKIRNLCYAEVPTAEQMIGWLEEQGILVNVSATFLHNNTASYLYIIGSNFDDYNYNEVAYPSRKEATLAAIDAALDYLETDKESA